MIESLTAAFLDLHREAQSGLTAAVRAAGSGGSATTAIAFAFALGTLHALTPGHGKAVVVSYFFGRTVRPLAGIGAGLRIAAAHILLAAVLVGLFGAAVTSFGRPAGAAAMLQTLAHATIALAGLWLLVQALRKGGAAVAATGHHRHVTTLAGLIPCPLTMLLLPYALANASLGVAVLLVLALGLGIATTIAVFALVAIAARRFVTAPIDRQASILGVLSRGLEIASAAMILGVGCWLFAGDF